MITNDYLILCANCSINPHRYIDNQSELIEIFNITGFDCNDFKAWYHSNNSYFNDKAPKDVSFNDLYHYVRIGL